MARVKEADERNYIYLKEQVNEDIEIYRLETKTIDERLSIANQRVKDLNLKGDEEKIYIANLVILDEDEFVETFSKSGKNLNICAKKIGVPQELIVAKVYEINKFGDLKKNGNLKKKGDGEMSENSIIDDIRNFPKKTESIDGFPQNKEKVDVETAQAIAKINQLFEKSNNDDQAIKRQASTIEQLNIKLSDLEEDNKQKDEEIETLEGRIKSLELKLSNSEQQVRELQKYKSAYEELTSFLNKQETGQKSSNR